jgi:hypothetical protein
MNDSKTRDRTVQPVRKVDPGFVLVLDKDRKNMDQGAHSETRFTSQKPRSAQG